MYFRTQQQRAEIIKIYHEKGKSTVRTLTALRKIYPPSDIPSKKAIYNYVHFYNMDGSLIKKAKANNKTPQTETTEPVEKNLEINTVAKQDDEEDEYTDYEFLEDEIQEIEKQLPHLVSKKKIAKYKMSSK